MLSYLRPETEIATIILVVLTVIGVFVVSRGIIHRLRHRRNYAKIFLLDKDAVGTNPIQFFKKHGISSPFSFEVSVGHLGKEISYYAIFPAKRANRLLQRIGAKEVHDHSIYSGDGSHQGSYFSLRSDSDADTIKADIGKINFTKVNEVGEGAVLQFVCGAKSKDGFLCNVRALTSAPSSFQASEILSDMRTAFPEMRATDIKSEDFIHKVNFREFEKETALKLIGD